MRYSLFHKRMKGPPLVEGQKPVDSRSIERLKAGRLASMALQLTARLIEQFGPRPAGSESARLTAHEIERSLKPFCDHTEKESVPLDLSFGALPLRVMVYLYPILVLLALFDLSLISLLLFALYLGWVYLFRYRYRPSTREPKKPAEGVNIHGILDPSGEVKRTILFTAHHDSAFIQRYNRLDRAAYLVKVGLPIALFGLIGILSFLLIFTKTNIGSSIILLAMLGATYFFIPLLSFYEEGASVGAGDNLNSAAIIVELARYFNWRKANDEPLSQTRLLFCSFDGEEVGLQGSQHWYREHSDLIEGAIVLNFDSIYYADSLTFLERDANATVQLSKALARRCVSIAHSMGYAAKSRSIPRLGGATDAASASRAGVQATTLIATAWDDRSKGSVQHTEADVVEAIEPKAVEQAISIAIRLVELVESNSLWEESAEHTEEPEVEKEPSLSFGRLTHR
jgi:aminopeptidase YwaD